MMKFKNSTEIYIAKFIEKFIQLSLDVTRN